MAHRRDRLPHSSPMTDTDNLFLFKNQSVCHYRQSFLFKKPPKCLGKGLFVTRGSDGERSLENDFLSKKNTLTGRQ